MKGGLMMPIVSQEAMAIGLVSKEKEPKKLVQEPVRFGFHAIGISAAGVLALALDPVLSGIAAFALVVLCIIGEALRASEKVPQWPSWTIISLFARAAHKAKVRDHEVGTRTATLDFSVALLIVWAFCPAVVVATACFITAWADPLARVVGKNWGSLNWPGSKKTLEGSGTCLAVATLIAGVMLIVQGEVGPAVAGAAIIVGVFTTAAELIPQKLLKGNILTPADNFWLVLASAGTLMACKHVLL